MISRRIQIAIVALVLLILGMGYYAIRLKQKAEARAQLLEVAPVPPPVAGPPQPLTIFVANDKEMTIRQQQVNVAAPAEQAERARTALTELIRISGEQSATHPLGSGSEVRAVFVVNQNLGVVDLNQAFADSHRSGIMVEELTIVSLVETLAANLPGITRVKFLVEGKERETLAGHADLKSTYDVASVAQIARELQ